jgi:uridine kinase
VPLAEVGQLVGMARCRIISVAGGTASGKTTLAHDLHRLGGPERVQVIPLDSYYRDQANISLEERALRNYDHPDAFDITLLRNHLDELLNGKGVDTPIYNFALHCRDARQVHRVEPVDVVIVEGILALHYQELREVYSYSVFVDTDDDLRFQRRLKRDVCERGRTEESVHTQWNATVHPMHLQYCAPTRALAAEVMTGERWDEGAISQLWKRIVSAVE